MKKFGLKDSNANKIFVVMKSIEHPKIPVTFFFKILIIK